MKKYQVQFVGFGLPFAQTAYVIAPNDNVAKQLIQHEAKWCQIISVFESTDEPYGVTFAECDENGNRQ